MKNFCTPIYLIFPIRVAICCILSCCSSCCNTRAGAQSGTNAVDVAERNIERAVLLVENAMSHYSADGTTAFSMTYNPFEDKSSEKLVSIWEYTSSIEAVTAVMNSLKALKTNGYAKFYEEKFNVFNDLLEKLYAGMDYYKGTFNLTSYTGTAEWSPYGVHRAVSPGNADVEGRQNVYDDQMWIIRELINAWKATGNSNYLERAEYLTGYVLDGWDCTLDADGNENGGITWGPGYLTKHACSNSPMISPLVWLHEIYRDKVDEIIFGVVNEDNTRTKRKERKADYYLEMAIKIYNWQKKYLLREDGVYDDLMGFTGNKEIEYEIIDGVKYRKYKQIGERKGPAHSYNSGTMLSGAADLYGVTGDKDFLAYTRTLTESSFTYFAKPGTVVPGLYTYSAVRNAPWFNDVLLRGFIAASKHYDGADVCVQSFQDCLDYAWDNYLKNNTLPVSLLEGWNMDGAKNEVNIMFTFARAAEYAVLAEYHLSDRK